MYTLCDSTNINTIIEFVPHVSGDGFIGGFWFVPSVPGYLREEEEHKPDPWRNPIERNHMGCIVYKFLKPPTIIWNNPVHYTTFARQNVLELRVFMKVWVSVLKRGIKEGLKRKCRPCTSIWFTEGNNWHYSVIPIPGCPEVWEGETGVRSSIRDWKGQMKFENISTWNSCSKTDTRLNQLHKLDFGPFACGPSLSMRGSSPRRLKPQNSHTDALIVVRPQWLSRQITEPLAGLPTIFGSDPERSSSAMGITARK